MDAYGTVANVDGSDSRFAAIGYAVIALAEEQRTANLIGLLASEGAWSMIGHERRDDLTEQILARLGLDT